MDEQIRKVFNKVLNSIFKSAQKSTIQLFHNDKPEREDTLPEPVGSGVFIELDNNYYIITAAHVVQGYALNHLRNPYRTEDDYDEPSDAYLTLNNIGIFYNQAYYPVKRVVFTNTENGITENNVDLAILFLDLKSVEELKQSFAFVTINRMVVNHTIDSENRYFIYGYPASWTNIDTSTGKIIFAPFEFVTNGILMEKVDDLRCYDAKYNILLSYNQQNIVHAQNGQPIEDFCPKGISGCGLWYYDNSHNLNLVGIMIEDKSIKEQKPLMMATRIDEAIAIIHKVKNE